MTPFWKVVIEGMGSLTEHSLEAAEEFAAAVRRFDARTGKTRIVIVRKADY